MFDGNSLGPGDGAAANRRGMIGDCSCNSAAKIGVVLMKGQEADHGTQEILDVLSQDNPSSCDCGSPDFFLEGVIHGVLSLLLWTNADWGS
jgi:hypothetical protein